MQNLVETPQQKLERLGATQPISNVTAHGLATVVAVTWPSTTFISAQIEATVTGELVDPNGLGYNLTPSTPEV